MITSLRIVLNNTFSERVCNFNKFFEMKTACLSFFLFLFLFPVKQTPSPIPQVANAPAGNRFVEISKTGETVIPNGRILTPAGKSIVVAPHPYGLTLSPDGNTVILANSGTSPLSITIILEYFI